MQAMAKGNEEKDRKRKTSKMSLEMILLIALTVAILVLAVVVAFVLRDLYKKGRFWTGFSEHYVGYLQHAINSNTLAINLGVTKAKAIDLRNKIMRDGTHAHINAHKREFDTGLIDVEFDPRFTVQTIVDGQGRRQTKRTHSEKEDRTREDEIVDGPTQV